MNNEKQREYFRLKYPVSYRPAFMMDIDSYEIVDVSEYGVKVKIDLDLSFMVDEHFMAYIVFRDGRVFDLSGKVVRIDQGYAGLELSTPLPYKLIRSEALHIIKNFPRDKGDEASVN